MTNEKLPYVGGKKKNEHSEHMAEGANIEINMFFVDFACITEEDGRRTEERTEEPTLAMLRQPRCNESLLFGGATWIAT